jgi:predicted transcriptional regulator
MVTTIKISDDMHERLESLKIFPRETYNDVLERILEDLSELNEETKKKIELARKQIEDGDYLTHEDLGKEMGFD